MPLRVPRAAACKTLETKDRATIARSGAKIGARARRQAVSTHRCREEAGVRMRLPLAMLLLRHAAALQRCTPSLRGANAASCRCPQQRRA